MTNQSKEYQIILLIKRKIQFIYYFLCGFGGLTSTLKHAILDSHNLIVISNTERVTSFDIWYQKFQKEMQSDPFHELYI